MRVRNRLAIDTANLVAATVAIGLVSYAVIFVGSRTFAAGELSTFLSLWALVNTLALSLAYPLETLAPQVLAVGKRSDGLSARTSFPHPLVVHAFFFGVVAGLGTLVAGALMPGRLGSDLQLGVLAFALSIGFWSGRRAIWIGSGDFVGARNSSFVNATVSLGLLAGVLFVAPSQVLWMFLAVAAGNIVGGAISSRRRPSFVSDRRMLLPADLYRVLVVLIGATAVTLVLQSGSLALADAWGIEPEQVVVYAALLSLVRVPMMLLNNVMGPLNLRIVHLSAAGEIDGIRRLFIRGSVLICVAVPVFAGVAAILGPLGVRLLVGGQYRASAEFAAAVMVTEGVVWLGMLPRFVLAARRANRIMASSWLAGLVAFAISAVALPSSPWKLVLVPLIAGLAILVGAIPGCFVVLRRTVSV